jgi:hypothetical protein
VSLPPSASGRPVRVAVIAHTHGNEPVGGLVLERFATWAAPRLVGGEVLAVTANLEARAQNLRFTASGRDMNRLWHRASLERLAAADPSTLCYEERRVRELAPLVATADVILDLHSTSRPSRPHLVFRDDYGHAELASKLGVKLMVTGLHEGAILEGGVTPDIGLDPGARGERLGFTLEAGQHTDPGNVEKAWDVLVRLLHALGMWTDAPPPVHPEFEVYEVIERFRQAPAGTAPYQFPELVGVSLPGTPRARAPRTLSSFETVEADEALLVRGTGEVIRAEAPFTMLMPAPTAKPGEDLYYICQRRHAALAVRPPTDDQARVEAAAVERFLDLLRDDEAQRGQSVVSFDSRRTLDLCAEIITRVTRLPSGHPHRRIVVVGRGDDDHDEASVRNARRYHQALDRAVAAGVQVDRVQLLRGAGFSWLRQLASAGVGATGPLRLFLAGRHPHTVSLLLTGDVERALADHDFHHVRVAMVVEASSVEVDAGAQAEVRTRTVRSGMLGSRPELLRIAHGMVQALRGEHEELWRSGALADLETADMLGADGAIALDAGSSADVLLETLFQVQLGVWRGSLRPHLHAEGLTRSGEAVARRVAELMRWTGISDPDGLLRVAFRPVEGGWVDDLAALDRPQAWAEWASSPGSGHRVPEQVLESADINRDNLDRWLGWKRFVAEVQALPGRSGRDLDMVFDGAEIRDRVGAWMARAAARGEREPGVWRLVIAGQGLDPRLAHDEAWLGVMAAQRSSLRSPGLALTRIQNTRATHLRWIHAFLQDAVARPSGSAPVELCWEAEHGGSINVLLLARRTTASAEGAAWSLEGWQVERAAVIVHDLHERSDQGDQLALFTEPDGKGVVNQELLHFARAHCEGLLRQARSRYRLHPGGGAALVRSGPEAPLLERIALVVAEARACSPVPSATELSTRFGLVDDELCEALERALPGDDEPVSVARRIWSAIGGEARGG